MSIDSLVIDGLVSYKDSSIRDELHEIATFFDLKQNGAEMSRLTQAQPSSLSRALNPKVKSRPRSAGHIGTLTAFVRTARAAIDEGTGHPPSPEGMRAWLYAGKVPTASKGLISPIEALSDPALAKEALLELEKERENRLGTTPSPPSPIPTSTVVPPGDPGKTPVKRTRASP